MLLEVTGKVHLQLVLINRSEVAVGMLFAFRWLGGPVLIPVLSAFFSFER